MNRIGQYADMEMVCMPKIPATLTYIACVTVRLPQVFVAGKRNYFRH